MYRCYVNTGLQASTSISVLSSNNCHFLSALFDLYLCKT